MARLKEVKRGLAMLVLDFDKQLEPGSFELALRHKVDQGLELTGLLSRIRNDDGGAPAYSPAVLHKIVLLAYSRGIISSRKMESACRDNVIFMVVSGESHAPPIDRDEGKRMITRRFASVEPVFGNLRYNKRLSRFTSRAKAKVDGQFKPYAMMHNIEKFAGSSYVP